jgi:hypothetical protein
VWTHEDQWGPLWEDVRTVAERLLDPTEAGTAPTPHFLGAVVLDQQTTPSGFITARRVIDGQQRLTTLQLLLDAVRRVVREHGAEMDAQALWILVRNDMHIAQHPSEVFKVWPTDRDRGAFQAAMDEEDRGDQKSSPIVRAHEFFMEQITEWAHEETGEEPVNTPAARLGALVRTVRDHLRMVVIDLEPGDNAQVIFETLNHRGSPLLAADLVKNLLFQIAEAQDADIDRLYRECWAPLDYDYWRLKVGQGRRLRPRIDMFLYAWLTMKLRREVAPDRLFLEFREFVHREKPAITDLLHEIAADARVYQSMGEMPATTVEGTFHYRVVKALDTAVVAPLQLWLMRWSDSRMPEEQRHLALRSLESWIVRRSLCRATVKDINRLIVELLRAVHESGPEKAGEAVREHLAGQRAESRFWIDDAQLRTTLHTAALYKSLTRPRLRMLLEALEDSLRGPMGEGQQCPKQLTVEHVMPQQWEEHWGEGVLGDPEAVELRNGHIHVLGNLTLVNRKLNPAMSNRPWTNATTAARGLAGRGKRALLLEHSTLKLNAHLASEHEEQWTEADIDQRTEWLAEHIVRIWPRPGLGEGSAVRAAPAETVEAAEAEGGGGEDESADVPGHQGKYRPLWRWLGDQVQDQVVMSFDEVTEIAGTALPESAYNHAAHWYSYQGSALGRAIRDAGWRATEVDLRAESVCLVRSDP